MKWLARIILVVIVAAVCGAAWATDPRFFLGVCVFILAVVILTGVLSVLTWLIEKAFP